MTKQPQLIKTNLSSEVTWNLPHRLSNTGTRQQDRSLRLWRAWFHWEEAQSWCSLVSLRIWCRFQLSGQESAFPEDLKQQDATIQIKHDRAAWLYTPLRSLVSCNSDAYSSLLITFLPTSLQFLQLQIIMYIIQSAQTQHIPNSKT